jgi:regulator of sigma E protease
MQMLDTIVNLINRVWPFLLVLGVLIFVHELGHFLVARWYGVRVITFSLGFGKKILKFTRGGVEYCVSLIPLGGYVKLAGETVSDAPTGDPSEFLSKSKWIRFQVYLAGPVMNLVLAVIILTFVRAQVATIWVYPERPADVGSVMPGSPADQAGIQVGDRIVAVNGREVPTWQAMTMIVMPRAERQMPVAIERNGQRLTLTVVPAAEGTYRVGFMGVRPVLRTQVVSVIPNSPAEKAGLQPNDVIVGLDDQLSLQQQPLIDYIKSRGPQPIVFHIQRGGQKLDLTIVPQGAAGSSLTGFVPSQLGEFRTVDLTLGEAFKTSLRENWEGAAQIGETLAGLFTRDTPMSQLMGPVAIFDLSAVAARSGWLDLFGLMALLSLNLGLLNLLPIPILDGGQIAILGLEGLFRREMSIRVKEGILLAGAAVIIILMVTVIFNDVARLIR